MANLEGQAIARVWFGDYYALYLEFGLEIGSYEGSGRPLHQTTLFVGSSWSATRIDGSVVVSEGPDARALLTDMLQGNVVISIGVTKSATLAIALEDGAALVATPYQDGEHDWCIYANEEDTAFFQEGNAAFRE